MKLSTKVNEIEKLSKVLTVTLWLLIGLGAFFYFQSWHAFYWDGESLYDQKRTEYVSDWAVFVSMGVAAVPVILMSLGLYQMIKMVRGLHVGRMFTQENAQRLSTAGRLIGYMVVASIVEHTLIVLALTLGNPPGHKLLQVAVKSQQLTACALALALFLGAKLISAAGKIELENEGTV